MDIFEKIRDTVDDEMWDELSSAKMNKLHRAFDVAEQRLEAGQHETFVILRETLEKELERFTEIQKTVKSREDINYYKGIRNGISNAINHIIQIEHPTK